MTDPAPGSSTGSRWTPTNPPVGFVDDDKFRHTGNWNSFQFDPPLTHTDTLAVLASAQELGYRMLFRRADYSLEQVQQELVDRGPSSILDITIIEEDISPKEEPPTAEERMAARLGKLAPAQELIVTDPYLFTSARARDADIYAASVARMMAPALSNGLHITAIVEARQSDPKRRAAAEQVRESVERELHTHADNLTISVIESGDFHDRFWIADGKRGLLVGASLNKIGRKIFFVDELSDEDVAAVVHEVGLIRDSK